MIRQNKLSAACKIIVIASCKTALTASVVLIACSWMPAFGDDESKSKSVESNTGSDSSSATPAKPSRVFEGGVKGTAILMEEGLAKIGLASDIIQESTTKIMKEAMRKDTIVMRGPNVLPGGVVIPALGGSGGVMQFGEMPIRRAKLEAWLADSDQSIKALQTYVDALILPEGISSDASQAYSELKSSMEVAQDHMARLKELASAKRLLNNRIAKEALKIHDTMAEMQREKSTLMQATEKVQILEKQ